MNLLITAPPMIANIDRYTQYLKGFKLHIPKIEQTLSERQLIKIIPKMDAWIIGDDPVTEDVVKAGKNLKALLKWGIGTDNVKFTGDIPFTNTPAMFNNEVSDVAIGYLLSLCHNLHRIHVAGLSGRWHKPTGTSLKGKKVALIGYGNIGRTVAKKLFNFDVDLHYYDPYYDSETLEQCLDKADVVILCCALTDSSRHLINSDTLSLLNHGTFLVNVSRGPVVDESALLTALESGQVAGCALDVFETEPLPIASELRKHNIIMGSHNASNTVEAVDRTTLKVIEKLREFIN